MQSMFLFCKHGFSTYNSTINVNKINLILIKSSTNSSSQYVHVVSTVANTTKEFPRATLLHSNSHLHFLKHRRWVLALHVY